MGRKISPVFFACAAIVFVAAGVRNARGAEPDEEFFLRKIQPILTDACFKCHSHAGDKIKGGLVVDSLSGLTAGGDTGPAIKPGDPEKSLLIEAVRYTNKDLQMPPKGNKLTDEQIALLTEWVRRGAPWAEPVSGKMTTRPKGKITEEDRQWWSFQPVAHPKVPARSERGVNEVDAFVERRLSEEGLAPAPPATKAELVRRVFYDVIGLPPSPEQVDAFMHDDLPGAYERLVDSLLASPRYGEEWARHWLDLVRYAESDGFRIDDYRPNAWRYRDYVVKSFNSDKPYDRFVAEQLAGDELAPEDMESRVATGYLRHWVYEYNNRDVVGQWTNILNDLTDVTSDVFLGLGVQCARCHDHKFDPILQRDYYRLQAFFAPIQPREDLKLATPAQEAEYREQLKGWEARTAELRAQIATLEAPHKKKAADDAIKKFPPETQEIIRKPVAERTPHEEQLAELAYRQVTYEYDRLLNKMRGPDKDTLVALYKQLSSFDSSKPPPLPDAFCATDGGHQAPPIAIPKKANMGPIEPGFLTILDAAPAKIPDAGPATTGRRTALARWITNPDNPLTSRVIVNRVWQYHFGRGLVGTSSDFGKLGELPSNLELLDYLARRFVEDGWSFKKLNRLILLSSTYQQSVRNPQSAEAQLKDPENRLLWRANTRRLSAEQIRDTILSATGELKLDSGGPSVDWTVPKRTVYTKVIRNTRDPLLDVFDAPEGFASTAQRNTTTTPTQSLLMLNSPWSLQRAKAFAARVMKESASSDPSAAIEQAYRLAYGRMPGEKERAESLQFLETQTAVIQRTELSGRAAVFVPGKVPFRDGQGATFSPGSEQQTLQIPANPLFPRGDFTAEAFIVLKSLYEDGKVRAIVSQWDGAKGHPGWSLGVTSKKSRYKPQTLVLQLSGDQPFNDKDPVEPIFSGLQVELGKPYYVAVSVTLDDTSETGVTFFTKDLSNDDEPMQVSQVRHVVKSGIASSAPLVIGGTSSGNNLFDGVIDDVRLSTIPLPQEQLLLTSERLSEHTVGYWKFEADPNVYVDSSHRGGDIVAREVAPPPRDLKFLSLTDLCQVLLNSNEFLYVD